MLGCCPPFYPRGTVEPPAGDQRSLGALHASRAPCRHLSRRSGFCSSRSLSRARSTISQSDHAATASKASSGHEYALPLVQARLGEHFHVGRAASFATLPTVALSGPLGLSYLSPQGTNLWLFEFFGRDRVNCMGIKCINRTLVRCLQRIERVTDALFTSTMTQKNRLHACNARGDAHFGIIVGFQFSLLVQKDLIETVQLKR